MQCRWRLVTSCSCALMGCGKAWGQYPIYSGEAAEPLCERRSCCAAELQNIYSSHTNFGGLCTRADGVSCTCLLLHAGKCHIGFTPTLTLSGGLVRGNKKRASCKKNGVVFARRKRKHHTIFFTKGSAAGAWIATKSDVRKAPLTGSFFGRSPISIWYNNYTGQRSVTRAKKRSPTC